MGDKCSLEFDFKAPIKAKSQEPGGSREFHAF